MSDECSGNVGGDLMSCTGAEFLRRAKVLIEEEQKKASPDNVLIDFICNAVRLYRECYDR